MEFTAHPDTFKQASTLRARIQRYQFTYPISFFVNDHHKYLNLTAENALVLLTAPGIMEHGNGRVIEGWLWKGDALKMYEMAYHAEGDVLELGTYAGLSTCIMAKAMDDSGRDNKLVTVDIADGYWKGSADLNKVTHKIDFRIASAEEAVAEFAEEGRKFAFIFVDHSHKYEDIAMVCPLLDKVLIPGCFVQFHDYSDARNGVEPDYGVFQAVADTLPKTFEFYGVYGCSGLYRYNP